jgi:hypothetical protein
LHKASEGLQLVQALLLLSMQPLPSSGLHLLIQTNAVLYWSCFVHLLPYRLAQRLLI